MDIDVKTEVNATALAVVLGVTARRVQQLAQDGVITACDRGFKTREQGGGDWEDNVEQLATENAKLREAGGGTYMASLVDYDSQDDQNKEDY